MSFGFSIGDFIAIGTLVLQLRQDYQTAPAEGVELANDLESLHSCLAEIQEDDLLNRCTEEKRVHLERILKHVQIILEELKQVRERYSGINQSWRVWDRIKFPRAQIRALRAKIHLQISLINLFMTALSTAALVRIENVLTNVVKSQGRENGVNLGLRPANDDSWATLLDTMERSGIERNAISGHKAPIEQLVDALSEVDQTISELSTEPDSTLTPADIDPFHVRKAVVGPPTTEQLVSSLCPSAVQLQQGRLTSIKITKPIVYQYPYRLQCKNCRLVCGQDKKLDNLTMPTNTRLIFQPRKDTLTPKSLEYYYEIHTQNRKKRDGLYFRSLFLWKCHVPALQRAGLLDGGGFYQCVFCPLEVSFKDIYTRVEFFEHIRAQHIQTPPSLELREKFNCWVDERTALFDGESQKLKLLKFDLLLPKAFEETETRFAMVQMNQAKEEKEKRKKKWSLTGN